MSQNHITLWYFNSLLLKMAPRNSGFTHWKWWFSIVMLVYQRVSFFSLYLSGGGPSVLEMWIFLLSVSVKVSLVESRKSTNIMFACHFLSSFFILQSCPLYNVSFTLHSFLFVSSSFPVMFLSCCIHFLSCSIATYQTYRYSKGDMLKPVRWVSAQMLALFSYVLTVSFCYCFAIGLKACPGCHLQGSWTYTCISSLSLFSSYLFLGRYCIGSAKGQAKLK